MNCHASVWAGLGLVVVLGATGWGGGGTARAAAAPAAFDGAKSAWHGFDRYDYLMDEQSLALKPAEGPREAAGQRRCIVVAPKQAAEGRPWSWRGCYWDHEPQTEIELLKRGFHIAYITADAGRKPDKKWDAWYAFLTEQHGLSKKPAFVGMSRGGEYAYTFATSHPESVSCIYADNPGGNSEMLAKLEGLARNDVPLLHVCGTLDPILGKFSNTIEAIYPQFGGRISVLIKEGAGHHPHSLRDPKPIADFIEQSVREMAAPAAAPAWIADKPLVRSWYYGTAEAYWEFPAERNYLTCRGPLFTECYARYDVRLGFDMPTTIIAPKQEAAGRPWVYRAGFVPRDAAVDQALLAKGYHIVVGPVGFNSDGPQKAEWDKLYAYLAEQGFAKKAVLEGAGGGAGEVCAWAIENPEKVACVYGENPVLRSHMVKTPPLDNLAPLAKTGVSMLFVCGSQDPFLATQVRVAETRYRELGGKVTVIVQEGMGHYPLSPKDPAAVVESILQAGK